MSQAPCSVCAWIVILIIKYGQGDAVPKPYLHCTPGDPDKLNVHLVAHSHDDVGWVQTIDEYYNGTKAWQSVKNILDSSIKELLKDRKRKFSYVEMAYFTMWWEEQDGTTKTLVRTLVDEGRLEFVGGGWCSNDEATTHYTAIIDQMALGLKFLIDTFGDEGIPKVAWQVDPFGHSKEQARLFHGLGLDGMFLGRLDFEEKDRRSREQSLEIIWESSGTTPLFTGITYGGYYPPQGFCFDQYCGDVMSDSRIKNFLSYIEEEHQLYTTNHIMITMGGDFHYTNATRNFYHTDQLIRLVNEHADDVHVFYSTPKCYLYAVNQAQKTYPVKTDDFFPYKDQPRRYWTGYFTSRPTLKYYGRQANSYLQAVKQLQALGDLRDDITMRRVATLARAVAVLQHHDGMTGTQKQHVAEDYSYRLSQGIHEVDQVTRATFRKLLGLNTMDIDNIHFCHQVNISRCPFTRGRENFTVLFYNPLARSRIYYAEIPVSDMHYRIIDVGGQKAVSQVYELPKIPGESQPPSWVLTFRIQLPPMSFGWAMVSKAQMSPTLDLGDEGVSRVNKTFIAIENEYLRLEFDRFTGLLCKMTNLEIGRSLTAKQELMYYKATTDSPLPGAYVFRPESSQPKSMAGNVKIKVVNDILVQEVHQEFQMWATQVIRLRKGERHAEFEWTVGPIPVDDNKGKDVISRFTTNIQNKGVFYTDSNGRSLEKRQRNFRNTWTIKEQESVAGNYYPVTSSAAIKDADLQLTVLTDRAQGASSGSDGQLDLMLHRRHLMDDGLGVEENLDEVNKDGVGIVIRGRHYVQVEDVENAARHHRSLAKELFASPVVALLDDLPVNIQSLLPADDVGPVKSAEFPANVHLLTLQIWNSTDILVRLENVFDDGEDDTFSQAAHVDLNKLFNDIDLTQVREMTLAANQKLDQVDRLVWKSESGQTDRSMTVDKEPIKDDLVVTLYPMQIRTFLVNVKEP